MFFFLIILLIIIYLAWILFYKSKSMNLFLYDTQEDAYNAWKQLWLKINNIDNAPQPYGIIYHDKYKKWFVAFSITSPGKVPKHFL
jgi:hypothetical protein